jgi:hypothetical protein
LALEECSDYVNRPIKHLWRQVSFVCDLKCYVHNEEVDEHLIPRRYQCDADQLHNFVSVSEESTSLVPCGPRDVVIWEELCYEDIRVKDEEGYQRDLKDRGIKGNGTSQRVASVLYFELTLAGEVLNDHSDKELRETA